MMLRLHSEENRKVSDLVLTIKTAIFLPMHEASQVKLEFEGVGFWGQGKTGVRGENPPGAKKRTNNNLNPGARVSMGWHFDGYFFSDFDGWRLNFRAFYRWRLLENI